MKPLNTYVHNLPDTTRQNFKSQINPVARWYKKSFYKHVQDLSQSAPTVEYIPLRDYYHRHTYGAFWTLEILVPYANMPVMRWLFGWTATSETNWYKLIPAFFRQFSEKNVVLQDFIVPIGKAKMALEFFHKQVEVCAYLDKLFINYGEYRISQSVNFPSQGNEPPGILKLKIHTLGFYIFTWVSRVVGISSLALVMTNGTTRITYLLMINKHVSGFFIMLN